MLSLGQYVFNMYLQYNEYPAVGGECVNHEIVMQECLN